MRKNILLALAGLVLVSVFWKVRLTDPPAEYQATGGDLYTQIYPMWFRAAEWMREGRLPLWNPYQSCGHPFLATVLYGVLYPPNLVGLWVPVEVAFEINIILHLWLGLAFMYLYGRVIGLGRPASAVAGLAYALSGAAAHEATWFTSTIASMVWLPLSFAALERVFAADGVTARRWGVALAMSVAMPLLAGWLQAWVYNVWALCAYGTCHFLARWRADRRTAVRGAALAALGLGLGVGVVAAQILPSMELQALGPRRPGGLSLQQVFPMAMPSPSAILGNAVDAAPGHPRLAYVGVGVLLLAPFALLGPRKRRRAFFLVAMAAATVLVSFSLYTPAYEISRLLPWGAAFRAPWRILCLCAFAMAALAGIAFDALARGVPHRSLGTRTVALLPALGLLLLTGVSGASWLYAAAGSLLLLAFSSTASPRLRLSTGLALTLLLGAELFLASRNEFLRPFQKPELLDDGGGVLEYIRANQGLDRTYVTNQWFIPVPAWAHKQATLRGIYSVTDYEGLSLERTAQFYRGLAGRFPPSDDLPFTGELHVDALRLKQLAAMSVRFIVTEPKNPMAEVLEMAGWTAVFAAPDGRIVYENPRVVPRAYVAYDARVAPDQATALTWMLRLIFDPFRFVVLERTGGAAPVALESAMPIQAADVVSYDPTRVEISAKARARAYLVLTDTWYPGWTARVDGKPAEIVRANYMFRAVALEPGEHRVTFVYEPSSLRVGTAISILAAGGLLLMAVPFGWLRRRLATRAWPDRSVARCPLPDESMSSHARGQAGLLTTGDAGGTHVRMRRLLVGVVQRVLLVLVGVLAAISVLAVASFLLFPAPAPPAPDPALRDLPVLRTVLEIAAPNVRGVFSGAFYETNSRGFRGPEVPLEPVPGEWRMIVTGDSVSMGTGIALEDAYPAQAERILRDQGVHVDVINVSLAGLHASAAVSRARELGMPYRPSVVVYGVTVNDVEDAGVYRFSTVHRDFSRNLLDRFLVEIGSLRDVLAPAPGSYLWELEDNWFDNPRSVAQFGLALDELSKLPCPILFVHTQLVHLHPWHPYLRVYARIEEEARARGIHVIQSFPAFQWRRASPLWIAPEDIHPNVEGSRIFAEALVAGLADVPCVPRY